MRRTFHYIVGATVTFVWFFVANMGYELQPAYLLPAVLLLCCYVGPGLSFAVFELLLCFSHNKLLTGFLGSESDGNRSWVDQTLI